MAAANGGGGRFVTRRGGRESPGLGTVGPPETSGSVGGPEASGQLTILSIGLQGLEMGLQGAQPRPRPPCVQKAIPGRALIRLPVLLRSNLNTHAKRPSLLLALSAPKNRAFGLLFL